MGRDGSQLVIGHGLGIDASGWGGKTAVDEHLAQQGQPVGIVGDLLGVGVETAVWQLLIVEKRLPKVKSAEPTPPALLAKCNRP